MPHKFVVLWLSLARSTCDSVMFHTGFCSSQTGAAALAGLAGRHKTEHNISTTASPTPVLRDNLASVRFSWRSVHKSLSVSVGNPV